MATEKQKAAARQNIKKAQKAQVALGRGGSTGGAKKGLSTAQRDRLGDSDYAFPKERKEPLTDARHVRNAIARFDQVEGVSDVERDAAWKRILAAAKRFDVQVSEEGWREVLKGGQAGD